MTRGRFVFRLITGGYLAWLGFDLVSSALSEKPESYVGYTTAGAVFMVIGLAWLLTGIRSYQKEQALEREKEELSDSEEAAEVKEIESDKAGQNNQEADENVSENEETDKEE